MKHRLYRHLEQLRHRQSRWGHLWLVALLCVISIQATQGYSLSNSSTHYVQICTEDGLQDVPVQTNADGDWVILHRDDICQACATVVLGTPPVVVTVERLTTRNALIAVPKNTAQRPAAFHWSPARPQPPPVVSPQSEVLA